MIFARARKASICESIVPRHLAETGCSVSEDGVLRIKKWCLQSTELSSVEIKIDNRMI